ILVSDWSSDVCSSDLAPEQAAQPIRQGLSAAGSAGGLAASSEARLLLVIDQLEELFTTSCVDAETRERFAAALEALARSGLVWGIGRASGRERGEGWE